MIFVGILAVLIIIGLCFDGSLPAIMLAVFLTVGIMLTWF